MQKSNTYFIEITVNDDKYKDGKRFSANTYTLFKEVTKQVYEACEKANEPNYKAKKIKQDQQRQKPKRGTDLWDYAPSEGPKTAEDLDNTLFITPKTRAWFYKEFGATKPSVNLPEGKEKPVTQAELDLTYPELDAMDTAALWEFCKDKLPEIEERWRKFKNPTQLRVLVRQEMAKKEKEVAV